MSQIENRMPQEHPRKLSKLLMILICLLLSFCRPSLTYSEPDYGNTPVFFVHGHGMSAKVWKPMISHFIKSGYPRIYLHAIQLKPKTGSNIEAAEKQIAHEVEEFIYSVNKLIKNKSLSVPLKKKVNLISHSMGALSARWYTAKIRPERVRIWLSIGGANHGTNSLCGWKDPGSEDLCPAHAKNIKESQVQYLLNGDPNIGDIDETPYGFGEDSLGVKSIPPDDNRRILYFSIRTYPDKWIKPEHSAILDGAGDINLQIPTAISAKETSPGNIVMTNRVGHDEMLSNKDTIKLIQVVIGTFD